jgi:hypothetical protein
MLSKKKRREYHRQRRVLAKANGVCIVCEVRPVVKHRTQCIVCRRRSRKYHRELKLVAQQIVAGVHEKDIECMIDLTPRAVGDGLPLSSLPHSSTLEIDHLNGGGHKEHEKIPHDQFYLGIIDGTYPIENLRLLCKLHNRMYEP